MKAYIQGFELEQLLIGPEQDIQSVIRFIDKNASQIALVVDENLKLLGTVTDGDIRRGLIHGLSLSDITSKVMNSTFKYTSNELSHFEAEDQMQNLEIKHLPFLDHSGKVIGLHFLHGEDSSVQISNSAVIMAGGRGERLRPITANLPKPLIQVGDSTLLDHSINQCVRAGITKFYISVNYLKEQIIEHLSTTRYSELEFEFLVENSRLGTAGALSLISEPIEQPLIVLNADVLHKADLRQLLSHHKRESAQMTIGARIYEHQIPFGVIQTTGKYVTEIVEKPVESYLVNAGIYVIEPELLEMIPKETYFDMPTLVSKVIGSGLSVAPFPVHEYWLDVGSHDSLTKANLEWE